MGWATTLTGTAKNVTIDGGGVAAFTAGANATSEGLKLTNHTQHTFSGNDQHHIGITFVAAGGVTEVNPWIGLTGDNLIIDSVRASGSLTQIVDFIRVTGARCRLSNGWVETNRHGLVLSGALRNVITDWYLSVGSQADDTWDGINLTTSDFNLIDGIEVVGDGGAANPRCGVNVTDAASNDNYVGVVHAPDATDPICDSGTDTILIALKAYVDSFFDFYNGTFQEVFNAVVTEAAGTITMSLTADLGGDLTMRFSDGKTVLDVTPAATITLTAGSDASPQGNWIYIPQSTKVLTKSTTAWPTTEHIKVGYFLVPSATFVGADGVYINQNWNDAAKGSNDQGHLSHLAEHSRVHGGHWFSGLAGAGVDDYLTLAGVTADLKIGAGVMYQMHKHNVAAFDTSAGDMALVVNWSGDSFHNVTNLFDITADSTGAAIGNNKFFNLTIWIVGNKSGEYEPAMINLPGGVYNTVGDAQNDVSGFDNFDIPRAFSLDAGVGILVARLTIQMKTAGPWIHQSTVDLRGTDPSTAAGAAGGVVTEFADNQFKVFDETDTTKIVELEVSGVTTATTRTLTIPDASGTIALVVPWTTWSPAYTNLTVGNGTVVARYTQIDHTVVAHFIFTLGTTSVIGAGPTVSMPVPAANYSFGQNTVGAGYILDSGTATFETSIRLVSSTTVRILALNATATYLGHTSLSAAIPMTWATGDVLAFQVTYEAI